MFKFVPFQQSHFNLFRKWLQQDHIKKYWHESANDENLASKTVPSYIIENNGIEIGFIQYYEARNVGNGWWPNEGPGVYGIDLMIGELDKIGIGLGPKIIKEFISLICSKESVIKSIIVDPTPENKSAIRAFEKAGFVRVSEITTPDGPALLMRIKLSRCLV